MRRRAVFRHPNALNLVRALGWPIRDAGAGLGVVGHVEEEIGRLFPVDDILMNIDAHEWRPHCELANGDCVDSTGAVLAVARGDHLFLPVEFRAATSNALKPP
jgi:hypothetical protein